MILKQVQIVIPLLASLILATAPAQSAEPTEGMRMMARMTVILETHDQKAYCAEMQTAPYADYLTRVCQSAVQSKLKKPADCSPVNIALLIKSDSKQCLAMPPAEFEKTVLRGREISESVIKDMLAQGVDAEKLLQEERAKKH
jgi:hypothetical protein